MSFLAPQSRSQPKIISHNLSKVYQTGLCIGEENVCPPPEDGTLTSSLRLSINTYRPGPYYIERSICLIQV